MTRRFCLFSSSSKCILTATVNGRDFVGFFDMKIASTNRLFSAKTSLLSILQICRILATECLFLLFIVMLGRNGLDPSTSASSAFVLRSSALSVIIV